MSAGMTVAEVFNAAKLEPCGPVPWLTPVEETRPGVYVLSLVSDPDAGCGPVDIRRLPTHLSGKWLDGHPVLYIGRTRRPLRQRIKEFYRHKYGQKSPHRGGQAVLFFKPEIWVFWAVTDQPVWAERKMIEAFRECAAALPFANRCRGAAVRPASLGA